jgi:hypothetical protein
MTLRRECKWGSLEVLLIELRQKRFDVNSFTLPISILAKYLDRFIQFGELQTLSEMIWESAISDAGEA